MKWNDPKDKRIFESSTTDVIIHHTKEELYHNILEILWGEALKVKVSKNFHELNLSEEGPNLDLEYFSSIYSVYLRLHKYTDILENEYKEGLEFKEYIKRFIREKKHCDINIDDRLEKDLIRFNYSTEERKHYKSDCQVAELFDLCKIPDKTIYEEYNHYLFKLIHLKIALFDYEYDFHMRPKDVKPLITKKLDRVIFKTKDYHTNEVDIEVIESEYYDNKYKFSEDAKDKLYDKVSLLNYNRLKKRKEYITTYINPLTNTLYVCMFELSETEINNMKVSVQRLNNGFTDSESNNELTILESEQILNECDENTTLSSDSGNKEVYEEVQLDEKSQFNVIEVANNLETCGTSIKTSIGRDVSLRKDKNDIYYFLDYHPYYIKGTKTRSPEFNDRVDGQVINLKKDEVENTLKRNIAIDYFRRILEICKFNVRDEDTLVTIVPSSKQYKYGKGLSAVAEIIANEHHLDLDLGILVRRNSIDKLSQGGDRHKEVHFNSISVTSSSKILGKSIIILDDVTTTGNSLLACKEILLKSGAARVDCISLTKTQHRGSSVDDLVCTIIPNELATF